MPSRDHYILYSTDLSSCTTDEELHRKIAELNAARAALPHDHADPDDFGDLDLTAVETDEEILDGIADCVGDENEDAAPPEVVISLTPRPKHVMLANLTPAPIVISASVATGATSDWSIQHPKLVKSLKGKRPVSVYRDAAFMRELQGLLARRDTGTLDPSSVSRLPLLTYPLDSTIFDRSSEYPPWWLWLNGGEPLAKPARQFRTPAAWRDVSDTLHVHYLHLGLKALGPVHAFTLILDESVEALARSKPDALGWLTARIARRLRDSLGRPVEFYCVAEEDDAGKLHLHGEVGAVGPNSPFPPKDLVHVRDALRAAGGEWPTHRQFQAKVPSESPDAGWAGYVAKDFAFFGPIVRPMLTAFGSRYAPGFDGDQVSRTKRLGEIAGKIYSEHRALVIAATRCGAKMS